MKDVPIDVLNCCMMSEKLCESLMWRPENLSFLLRRCISCDWALNSNLLLYLTAATWRDVNAFICDIFESWSCLREFSRYLSNLFLVARSSICNETVFVALLHTLPLFFKLCHFGLHVSNIGLVIVDTIDHRIVVIIVKFRLSRALLLSATTASGDSPFRLRIGRIGAARGGGGVFSSTSTMHLLSSCRSWISLRRAWLLVTTLVRRTAPVSGLVLLLTSQRSICARS
jgi:hypothetical protein